MPHQLQMIPSEMLPLNGTEIRGRNRGPVGDRVRRHRQEGRLGQRGRRCGLTGGLTAFIAAFR
ncbi:MAG TPA: hypothetical protein VFJ10_11675 [Acidobacteriaceae bacterium]|nr:hypothetical protein [Acidobacteriaceae bacterium]